MVPNIFPINTIFPIKIHESLHFHFILHFSKTFIIIDIPITGNDSLIPIVLVFHVNSSHDRLVHVDFRRVT